MRPNVHARDRELSPEPSMSARSEQVELEDRYDREDCLHESFAARTVFDARPVHTVEQLARSDRRDCGFFVRPKALRETLADQARRVGPLLSSV